jgi:hypothetical protein
MHAIVWLKTKFWMLLGLPRCDKITRLVSQSMDRKLSWKEEFLLDFHCAICGQCDCFHKQLEILRDTAQTVSNENAPGLSAEARNRMKQRLERAAREPFRG